MTARRFAVFDEPRAVTLFEDPENPDGLDLEAGFRAACAAAGWYGIEQRPEVVRHNRWPAAQEAQA